MGRSRDESAMHTASRRRRVWWGLAVGVNDYRAIKATVPVAVRQNSTIWSERRAWRPCGVDLQKSWAALRRRCTRGPRCSSNSTTRRSAPTSSRRWRIWQSDVGPEDRCIIFLAGHGIFVEHKATKERPPSTTWLFCCPDFDATRPEETGITSEVLYEKLAKIAGRKLVILDACHSGEAAYQSVCGSVKYPGGQGPIIIASCDRNQSAYEDPGKR